MAKYAISVGVYLLRKVAVFGSVPLYHTVTHDYHQQSQRSPRYCLLYTAGKTRAALHPYFLTLHLSYCC